MLTAKEALELTKKNIKKSQQDAFTRLVAGLEEKQKTSDKPEAYLHGSLSKEFVEHLRENKYDFRIYEDLSKPRTLYLGGSRPRKEIVVPDFSPQEFIRTKGNIIYSISWASWTQW